MSFIRRLLGDTFIYGFATVLPKLANVFLVKLHTELLHPDQYAINTSFYIYAAYLNVLLTLGMETTFFRFFNIFKKRQNIIITNTFGLLCLASTLFITLFWSFSKELTTAFNFQSESHIQLLGLTILFDTISVVPFVLLRASRASKKFSTIKILNTVVYIAINILLLWVVPTFFRDAPFVTTYLPWFKQPNVTSIFVANTIASLVTLLMLLPVLFNIKFCYDISIIKKMIRYSAPIVGSGLAYITIENIDKLFLQSMISSFDMGIYAACYKLGVIINIYVLSFRLGAEPLFFQQVGEKNAKKSYAITLKWFFIVGSLIYLTAITFLNQLSSLLLGDESYYKALSIVPIILLSNLFFGGYINLSIWYKITNRTHYGLYFSLIGAVLTVIINYWFIPLYGFFASAYATLISYLTMFLVSYFLGQKHYKIPYDIKSVCLYIAASVILGLISLSVGTLGIKVFIYALFLSMVYYINRQNIHSLFAKTSSS